MAALMQEPIRRINSYFRSQQQQAPAAAARPSSSNRPQQQQQQAPEWSQERSLSLDSLMASLASNPALPSSSGHVRADMALQIHRDGAAAVASVAEIKRIQTMTDKDGNPLDLLRHWNMTADGAESAEDRSLRDSARNIISQIYTYMVLTQVQLAWVSCYKATWLVWRPISEDPSGEQQQLQLSAPFLHTASAPSDIPTMAALTWLSCKSVELCEANQMHAAPTGPPSRPAILKDDTDDDSGEDDGALKGSEEQYQEEPPMKKKRCGLAGKKRLCPGPTACKKRKSVVLPEVGREMFMFVLHALFRHVFQDAVSRGRCVFVCLPYLLCSQCRVLS